MWAQECPPEVRERLEVKTILCARTCRRIWFTQGPKCPVGFKICQNRQNCQNWQNRQNLPRLPKKAERLPNRRKYGDPLKLERFCVLKNVRRMSRNILKVEHPCALKISVSASSDDIQMSPMISQCPLRFILIFTQASYFTGYV